MVLEMRSHSVRRCKTVHDLDEFKRRLCANARYDNIFYILLFYYAV
jgi:hypothetical protein